MKKSIFKNFKFLFAIFVATSLLLSLVIILNHEKMISFKKVYEINISKYDHYLDIDEKIKAKKGLENLSENILLDFKYNGTILTKIKFCKEKKIYNQKNYIFVNCNIKNNDISRTASLQNILEQIIITRQIEFFKKNIKIYVEEIDSIIKPINNLKKKIIGYNLILIIFFIFLLIFFNRKILKDIF